MKLLKLLLIFFIGFSTAIDLSKLSLESKNTEMEPKNNENGIDKAVSSFNIDDLREKNPKEIKLEIERMLFSNEDKEIKKNKIKMVNELLMQKIMSGLSQNALAAHEKNKIRRSRRLTDDFNTNSPFKNTQVEESMRKNQKKRRNLINTLSSKLFNEINEDTTVTAKKYTNNQERRLQDDVISRASAAIGQDTTSTSSKLKEITQQEKAMQNYQKVQNWVSDVNFKVNDLRSNIQRRIQDFSVGLQRRSLLIGHYNYMGQGMGNPQGESMSNMNPYYHF